MFAKNKGRKRKIGFNTKRKYEKGQIVCENVRTGTNRAATVKYPAEKVKKRIDAKEYEIQNEEFEDEFPFNKLVNSLNCADISKYISSSESDTERNERFKIFKDVNNATEESHSSDEDVSMGEDCFEKDNSEDPFEIHFQRDLGDSLYRVLSTKNSADAIKEYVGNFSVLGRFIFSCPSVKTDESNLSIVDKNINLLGEENKLFAVPGPVPVPVKNVDPNNLTIKTQILGNISKANLLLANSSIDAGKLFTPLQEELFSIINNYQDLYYPNRTLDNGEEIRFVYTLHAVNHALKTRLKVIHHNSRLSDKIYVPDEFRDQSLVRPKILLIVPFRNSALRVVKMIISILLPDEKANIVNKRRFFDEFSGGEIVMPRKNPKPVDYERTFEGNTDDNFRIGISITKKSLKLYSDFYSSDIIIASPLGLRLIVGAEGEAERDYDFLASIEVLILDQTEIFLMQNWDHLLHVLDHLHLQPREGHGTDFSRVRNWALNGWTQYYRQTLIFSSQPSPLITALFVKKCKNYAGKVTISNPASCGSICQVAIQVPQVFCRVDCGSSVDSVDKRYAYFLKEILPQIRDPSMKHTIIYIPSYLDYVMIRNHFKKETISFVQICEYSKDSKVARARDKFFHGESQFLLYSERFHFFKRVRVKGICHVIFYQPPTFPHFYSELCNLIDQDIDTFGSITVLYTKYDLPQLAAIVGTERANHLLHPTSSGVHRLVAKQ